jgi:sterol desaturase/sphingolipid hydroxylase (fatty acid hydroxylase superfamily)
VPLFLMPDESLATVFSWLLQPGQRTFWGFWLSTVLIALIWAAQRWSVRAPLLRQWLSRDYWWHPSARQDYALILLNALLFMLLGSATLVLILMLANLSYELWSLALPPAVLASWHGIGAVTAYALVLLLLDDFSRYGLHRALHSRWLWRIHRLHHSAAVLTPLTFLRVHPLEKLLYQWRTALVHGGLSGSYFFAFGQHAQPWLIAGISGSVLLFNLLGANLRHSHIPLRYGALERVFISPAQHQFHHSLQGSRSNYGSMLAIWDGLFGSWQSGAQQAPLPQRHHHLIQQLLLKRVP